MVKRWEVSIDGPLLAGLLADLQAGPIVDDRGRRMLTEARVGTIVGLTVHIYADEHPPPHFCVRYGSETANFRISDGMKINGGLDRFERNIRRWHGMNREHLIDRWNLQRPSDCPVGAFEK